MKVLGLEFYKLRHRHIGAMCLCMIAMQLLWEGVSILRLGGEGMGKSYLALLYDQTMLDSIMLPLLVAVLASRTAEMEHKGGGLKLLETLITPAHLYGAKMMWGVAVISLTLVMRMVAFIWLGSWLGFAESVPWALFVCQTLLDIVVAICLYALSLALALRYKNQAMTLILGLGGSFLGTMVLFFPFWLQRLLPWGYFGVLSVVRMDYNSASRVVHYYTVMPTAGDGIGIVLWMVIFVLVGRWLFVRKEV